MIIQVYNTDTFSSDRYFFLCVMKPWSILAIAFCGRENKGINEDHLLVPLYLTWINFLLTWISYHEVWDTAIEVWEWISNFISHFSGCMITYSNGI